MRLKDKWQQRVRVDGQELRADVYYVTMLDGVMFGRVKASASQEIEVIKHPNKSYWTPIFTKE